MYNNHRIAFKDALWYAIPGSNGSDYSGPVAFRGRVFSAPSVSGVDVKRWHPRRHTDKTVLCEIGSIPPCRGALLWINREPLLDKHGKLALDGNGYVITPATHIATRLGISWDNTACEITAAVVPAKRHNRREP